jgi:hypothetical protein
MKLKRLFIDGSSNLAPINITCPYCRDVFESINVVVVKCSKCSTLYHIDCFTENSRCAVAGCFSIQYVPSTSENNCVVSDWDNNPNYEYRDEDEEIPPSEVPSRKSPLLVAIFIIGLAIMFYGGCALIVLYMSR